MVCPDCGRPLGGLCAGCRTVGRIRFLWGQQLRWADDTEGLAILRNCAGGLLDLVESQFGSATSQPLAGATAKASGAAPPGVDTPEVPPTGAPKSQPKKATPVDVKKEETEEKERKKESEVSPGVEEESEEAESSPSLEEDTSVVEEKPKEEKPKEAEVKGEEPEAPKEEAKPARTERAYRPFQRGCLGAPLGLRPLPIQLSPRDGVPPSTRERKKSRREEDKDNAEEKKRAEESRGRGDHGKRESQQERGRERPRSPVNPPADRARGSGREGDSHRGQKRHRHKESKSKRVKKRQRGRDFRKENPNAWRSSSWRPRHDQR